MSVESARAAYNSGEYKEAIAKASDAITEDPRCYQAWVLRGASLLQLDNPYSAILDFTRAISINAATYDSWNNRGTAYSRISLWNEAIADLNQAVSLGAGYLSHFALGLTYSTLEKPIEAEFHFREAIKLSDKDNRNHHVASVYLGTLLQGLGYWEEGLKLDQHRYNLDLEKLEEPVWQGEDLSHKHIFLKTESGWGDKICSLRFVNSIIEKYQGVKVSIGTTWPLADLIRTSFPELTVTIRRDAPRDYACSLLDVPLHLGFKWDTVPRPNKYLTVDPRLIEKWRVKFKELPKGINVGLCWCSFNGMSKTVPPWSLVELGGVPNCNFISLQKPYREHPQKQIKIYDWTGEINDWADTGAIIENCDIVVSIDTGVAHLAGALGKPVWNIVRYSTYWPWMQPNIPPTPHHSIWYPSMTLFRQRQYGDWFDPIRRITLELLSLTQGG